MSPPPPERIEQAKQDWRNQAFAMIPGDDEFIPPPGGIRLAHPANAGACINRLAPTDVDIHPLVQQWHSQTQNDLDTLQSDAKSDAPIRLPRRRRGPKL
ncbi:hypothetical protein G8770_23390 [Aestuariicella hydrocarbonica]|uniref:Uncharacterized protein n=1 Tax=Pseudomaricurvus hydrocarbonicus TaxID=1470433 RepID=A0A9E5T519_9GAMM|nr:hypothetical protein [Aestuariicella hydrocarbonica]NHO68507.1 hypothetical protein [Aestuariicella hydrocarbonica]